MSVHGETFDVAVIGAGPAGLAAATLAARHGASAVLIDENAGPGGQIYRHVERATAARRKLLGPGYARGLPLIEAFRASGARFLPETTVWTVSPQLEIGTSHRNAATMLNARHLVLATGALERPFPVPGWTMPGVMGAGAAQILLKTGGLVADGAVLAGTGPLLWLLASQYLAAGGRLAALLDTTPPGAFRRSLTLAPALLRSSYGLAGLRLLLQVRSRIRTVDQVTALRAEGEGQLERVVFRRRGGPEQVIGTDLLFLHQGVVPNVNVVDAIGCRMIWDDAQLSWRPETDLWQRSSLDNVWVAGDGAGILGADAAALTGRLAALDVLSKLGRLSEGERDAAARPIRGDLQAARRGRPFLDAVYRPDSAFRLASSETMVCRCEEVSTGQVREAVEAGCVGPNQLKSFLRCGMGPCQGRLCGTTLTQMIAGLRRTSPTEVGGLHLRPPFKPITLGELATLPKTQADIGAVVRF